MNLISILLCSKCNVQGPHTLTLPYYKLKTYFHQLEPSSKEFTVLSDREMDHLLLIDVMVGLEVNSLVSDIE